MMATISPGTTSSEPRVNDFVLAVGHAQVPLRLDRWDRHARVTYEDCTETTIEHEVSFRLSPSYMPILDFMTLHLSKYRSFSVDMFVELRKGGFGTVKSTAPD
ncbi:hypothetical protein ASG47_07085 [Devosia sp. Leaf420]|nr:hypothetical protein ASG47_07085 [Devosia sp. Leaf420]